MGGLDGMILIRGVTPATPAEPTAAMSPLEAASVFLPARLRSQIGARALGPPPRWPSAGTELQAHSCPVRSLAFSADGRLLASGGEDHSIALWDVSVPGKPRKIHVLSGHLGAAWSLAFSPNGKTLATGSLDNTVMLWDVARGTLKTTLKGHANSVMAVAFSPDGKTVASGSSDHTVKLWDAADAEPEDRPERPPERRRLDRLLSRRQDPGFGEPGQHDQVLGRRHGPIPGQHRGAWPYPRRRAPEPGPFRGLHARRPTRSLGGLG